MGKEGKTEQVWGLGAFLPLCRYCALKWRVWLRARLDSLAAGCGRENLRASVCWSPFLIGTAEVQTPVPGLGVHREPPSRSRWCLSPLHVAAGRGATSHQTSAVIVWWLTSLRTSSVSPPHCWHTAELLERSAVSSNTLSAADIPDSPRSVHLGDQPQEGGLLLSVPRSGTRCYGAF